MAKSCILYDYYEVCDTLPHSPAFKPLEETFTTTNYLL